MVSKFSAEADPKKTPRELRQLLLDAVRREWRIAEYEMDVRYFGDNSLVTTFLARLVDDRHMGLMTTGLCHGDVCDLCQSLIRS